MVGYGICEGTPRREEQAGKLTPPTPLDNEHARESIYHGRQEIMNVMLCEKIAR